MAILRPSFSQIYSTLYTDIQTGLGSAPIARFSILGSVGRALARALDSCYNYVDNVFLSAVPWTARGTSQDAWAALWGVTRRPPLSASGTATMTFNGSATIPTGSSFTAANTVVYTSVGDVVASGAGTQTVQLVTTSTGAVTNITAGTIITLVTSIANVVPNGSVIQMVGGADAETDDSLFARAQEVRSNPPQGGAVGDYITWTQANNAVTRTWVQPSPATPGNVVVYVMLDGNTNNGFPIGTNGCSQYDTRGAAATGDQLIAANYIWQQYRRPVTAFVTVVAPIAQAINLTVASPLPNTTAAKAAAAAAVQARFLAIGTPVGMTIYESDISQAIQTALTSFNLTTPNTSTSIALGSLPTLGTITWT